MYFQKRNGKYSFVYYDEKLRKNVRLRNKEIPLNIKTDAEAERFCRLKEAEVEAVKLRIQRRLDWQNKFYDFDELIELYAKDRRKKATGSWGNDLYYLRYYVMPFFLGEKSCNNLNNWSYHFSAFRDWLDTIPPLKRKKGEEDRLAYSTRNHCIKALNTFLEAMRERNKMDAAPKCQVYPKHLLGKKTIENVIRPDEQAAIRAELVEINLDAAEFFDVLIGTGLRISEALGLSLGDVFRGAGHESSKIVPFLKKHEMTAYGHIFLMSQLEDSVKMRLSDGTVPRAPLKGKKVISSANARTIPILDVEVYNILASRMKEQSEKYKKGTFGANKKDYLLFDRLNFNSFSRMLGKACERAKSRMKFTPHDCRHTFCTRFAGLTLGDFFFCQLVLGHKDIETTRAYLHLHEEIQRDVETQTAIEEDCWEVI